MNINKWYKHIFQNNEKPEVNIELTEDMKNFISSTAFIFGNKLSSTPSNNIIKQYYDALKRGAKYSNKVNELYDIAEIDFNHHEAEKVRKQIWKAVTKNNFDDEGDVFDLINPFRLMIYNFVKGHRSNILENYFILDRNGNIIGIKEEFSSRFNKFSGQFDKIAEFFDKIDSVDEDYKPGLARLILEPDGNGIEQAISLMESL